MKRRASASSILEEIKMIGRSRAMTNCQAVADSFGHIGLGRLNCVHNRVSACELCGDRRCIRAPGAMSVRRCYKLAFEHVEESAVIEHVGGALGDQMPALDQHML